MFGSRYEMMAYAYWTAHGTHAVLPINEPWRVGSDQLFPVFVHFSQGFQQIQH